MLSKFITDNIEELTDEILNNTFEIEFKGKLFKKDYDGNLPEAFRIMLRREYVK